MYEDITSFMNYLWQHKPTIIVLLIGGAVIFTLVIVDTYRHRKKEKQRHPKNIEPFRHSGSSANAILHSRYRLALLTPLSGEAERRSLDAEENLSLEQKPANQK